MSYELAVERLRSYCHLISDDYNRDAWYGQFFYQIQIIQKQLDDEIPDVQVIISCVNIINTLTKTKHGKTFRTTFGKISNHPENILDVIATIGNHFKLILSETQKAPRDKQTQIRPMASLLRRLRQCA